MPTGSGNCNQELKLYTIRNLKQECPKCLMIQEGDSTISIYSSIRKKIQSKLVPLHQTNYTKKSDKLQ